MADPDHIAQVSALEQAIRHHNYLYWEQHQPQISDYDYDQLVERLRALAPQSPVLEELGQSDVTSVAQQITHDPPMLSLDKCYTDDDLLSWSTKFEGQVIVTPKFDGVAAALRYDHTGALTIAATRGRGTVGEDFTENAKTIADIPQRIIHAQNIEVRGEVYLRLSRFADFGDQFANPRNLVAGAIKHKDPQRCRDYQLSFVAYDLLRTNAQTEVEKLLQLVQLGFAPIDYVVTDKTAQTLKAAYEHFAASRTQVDHEMDGVVFKANLVAEQTRLGQTNHHPRYAIAYKFQGDCAATKLVDVLWSVARTGAITPIAVVEPILLSGAMISRASLHHAGYVEKLGITIGATVEVTRRGGVIPKVERVLHSGTTPVPLPQTCPSCGQVVRTEGDFLYCSAPQNCREAQLAAIADYCRILNIKGFGDKILAAAYDTGLLRTPDDLYRLSVAQLLPLDRMGEKLATKLVEQIQNRRNLSLETFLRALGIDDLGPHISAVLARRYGALFRIQQVSADELTQLHGVGEIIAKAVVEGLKDKQTLIDKLLEHVRVEEKPPAEPTDSTPTGPLAGQSFVFTGALQQFDRETAQQRVQQLGGATPSTVSKKLTYLVIGAGKEDGGPSSKQRKAEQLIAQGAPIQILSEAEFLQLTRNSDSRD